MDKHARWLALIAAIMLLALFTGVIGCSPQESTRHILKIGFLREIEGLNPFTIWSYQAYEVMNLNYNRLITWDEDMNVVPDLAKEWTVSEDGLTWTFKLQEGVKWHDGEPFTSADVKFTFEYIRDNELGYFVDYVAAMTDIQAPDDATVVITLEEPLAWMPNILVPILPKHIWENVDPEEANSDYENAEPIGTGPFRVVEHVTGEYTRMVANKDYFKGAPKIDEIFFQTFANADLMVEALKRGDIDAITSCPAAQFKALQEEAPEGITLLDAMTPAFTELSINVWDDPSSQGNPLLRDQRIRAAMEHAIDRQRILEVDFFGYGEVGSTLVPSIYDFWHLKLDESEFRSFDLEKSKGILEEAGYKVGANGIRVSPNGEPLSFTVLVRSESPDSRKAAELIREWFKEVGIELKIEAIDEGALTDRIYEGNFDMFIWGWFVDIDPSSILKIMTTGEIMSWSDCFYSNPEYDELYEKQRSILDPEERREVIHEMQRIVYRDAPYIILSYDPELQAYRTDRFKGWVQNPAGGPVIFTNTIETYEKLEPIN